MDIVNHNVLKNMSNQPDWNILGEVADLSIEQLTQYKNVEPNQIIWGSHSDHIS